ncbi:MAG TPA: FG-GAP-like repeat-containing protein [Myxococcaceae bacterium]|nr:FG-GAP-like repeat-containing protein [Myxococcaceae bacterium]
MGTGWAARRQLGLLSLLLVVAGCEVADVGAARFAAAEDTSGIGAMCQWPAPVEARLPVAACAVGLFACEGQCVSVETDALNCGACGRVCPGGRCSQGRCDVLPRDCRQGGTCATGETCDAGSGRCKRACAANADCGSGALCDVGAGQCKCPRGTRACGGACVSDSPQTCGVACARCPSPPANAQATCTGGACGFTCAPGFRLCGGACVKEGSGAARAWVTGVNPRAVAIADLNRDGRSDLVVGHYGRGGRGYTVSEFGSVAVMLQQADGTFGAPLIVDDRIRHVRQLEVRDHDGDGVVDLAANGHTLWLYRGQGDGTFVRRERGAWGAGRNHFASGDFNADGRADFIVDMDMDNWGDEEFIGHQQPDGTFARKELSLSPWEGFTVAASGRFNEDEVDDFVAAGFGYLAVWLVQPDGSLKARAQLTLPGEAAALVSADFNRDGAMDVAIAHADRDRVVVLYGDGKGLLRGQTALAVGAGPTSLAVGDANADGWPDLAVAHGRGDSVGLLRNDGAGRFQAEWRYGAEGHPASLALGDLDGDGRAELVVAESGRNRVRVIPMDCQWGIAR